MGNRIYNILFNTHTVSGIVISVALYIIFFTGSFSFFRDEITNWQRGHSVSLADELPGSIDRYLQQLSLDYGLYGREVELTHYFNERNINVRLGVSQDTLADAAGKAPAFFYMDTVDGSQGDYAGTYHLGEFLYRLHFLDQIPYPYGRTLAGLVAFFFLFAIITGFLVHWNKIASNFFTFRPWAKAKTLWTDAHTALGVIGLPFQFVYAVTGAFFLLKGLLILPVAVGLYQGDENRLYEDLEYTHPHFDFFNQPMEGPIELDPLIADLCDQWGDFRVTETHIFNYGDKNMHVAISGHLDHATKLNGLGYRILRVADGSIVKERVPMENDAYLDGVKNMLFRLHFGDYAGYGLRVVSFVLGLISCFVILSGVMIWLVAREKRNIPEKRRRFNRQVANVYMAICLSMFPVTALEFLIVKFAAQVDMAFMYRTYFPIWLLTSLFFILKNKLAFTNKWSLALGGILGLLIPVANGVVSGNWLWSTIAKGAYHILVVDLLWLFLGLVALWIAFFKLGKERGSGKMLQA